MGMTFCGCLMSFLGLSVLEGIELTVPQPVKPLPQRNLASYFGVPLSLRPPPP